MTAPPDDALDALPALAARTEPARGLVVEPTSGAHVLVATHREGLARENTGQPVPAATAAHGLPNLGGARCPFCPGHEADAEPTLAQHPPTGPWRVRAVGNRFPLVGVVPGTAGGPPGGTGVPGAHELIIETRAHDDDLDAQGPSHLADVLGLLATRLRAARTRDDARAVYVFRNRGRRAGSSQPHPHTQLVTLPAVPPELARRAARARAHLDATGARLSDVLRDAEARAQARVVRASGAALTFCPRVSRRPYELWVMPTDRSPSLADAPAQVVAGVAAALADAVARLRAIGLADAYNVLLREPPVARAEGPAGGAPPTPAGGWWLEVHPRTAAGAGFELGSGVEVLTVAPEAAAERLRRAHLPVSGPAGPR
jgi:UDPglucose--hexose-1-phosphate uridylyltransferase